MNLFKKRNLVFVFLFFICPFQSVSQVQDSFFPIQIGNSWKMLDWDSGMWGEEVFYTHFVSDSVKINNKTYYHVNMHHDRFFREDSAGLFYEYRDGKEIVLFDFKMTVGDTFAIDSGFCCCLDRKTVTTFRGTVNEEIHFYVDWWPDIVDEEEEYTFQKNVGLVRYKPNFHSIEILKQVVLDGRVYGEPTIIADKKQTGLPLSPELSVSNYPNPFNGNTVIEFYVPHEGFVDLNIYNSIGQKSANLVYETVQPGRHRVTWDSQQFPSGSYFIKMEFDDRVKIHRITLLK
ncbi:T9SS type A sorting domain-containing protein [candidate division KSB1 bacterium]|nr:T9SS type A sorting domain-containing protein [candidate division KSB1 bacterium]